MILQIIIIAICCYGVYKLREIRKEILKEMATQEERLQAAIGVIRTKVAELTVAVATLKENNPDLEDEIADIEAIAASLGTAVEVPPVEPTPDLP